MIAVVDYGVGNLYSLTCSLRHIGAACTVTREEEALRTADRIILPGVGAFGTRRQSCAPSGWMRCCASWPGRASRSWASAWACSCSLTKAMNTASIQGWA